MPQQIDIVANLLMKVDGAEAGINKLKSSLSKLEIPKGLENGLNKSFSNLDSIFERYKKQLSKGFDTKADVSNMSKIGKELDSELTKVSDHIHKLTGERIDFKVDSEPVKRASKDLEEILEKRKQLVQQKLEIKVDSQKEGINNIKQLLEEFQRVVGNTKAGNAVGNALFHLDTGDLQKALPYLKEAENSLTRIGEKKRDTFSATGFTLEGALTKAITGLSQTDSEFSSVNDKAKLFQQILAEAQAGQLKDVDSLLARISQGFDKNAASARDAARAAQDYAQSTYSIQQQVSQLQQSTQYFFSLRNMINLLKRGVREAVQTVKELDAAMTETAVVTKFDVGDMWAKLPEYTANANALGATVQDMYESTTLYYQQGLNAQQAMGIAAETMKMARIGGLEAAEATDMMTAALRGFNMELNETSAQRINDVYSNLAAKTASNTEELGTAMQRTASIAASAGMSFEGTTAFLAQAIETTREPAENLGTAMKTIIARFQELKKNPLDMTEVEGETVDYNKVDAALKTIGVDLKDTNGQFRNLDQVFLDISQRWDSLTQTQQRYIATTAAGSRQQSRFIAMMSNYDRTMQLMEYANNAEGASNEQFGKTLESLEAKLNKFQNAWKQFLMGIMNDSWTKGIVDGATTVVNAINNIINTLSLGSKGIKSALSIFTAFTALKVAGRGANALIGGLGGMLDPQSNARVGMRTGAIGRNSAQAINQPIVKELQSIRSLIAQKINTSNLGKNQVIGPYDEYNKFKSARAAMTNINNDGGGTIQDLKKQLSGLSGSSQNLLMNGNAGTFRAATNAIIDQYGSKMGSSFDRMAIRRGERFLNNQRKSAEITAEEYYTALQDPGLLKKAMLKAGVQEDNAAYKYIENMDKSITESASQLANEAKSDMLANVKAAVGKKYEEGSEDYIKTLKDSTAKVDKYFESDRAKEFYRSKALEKEGGPASEKTSFSVSKFGTTLNNIGKLGTGISQAGMGIQAFGSLLTGSANPAIAMFGSLLTSTGGLISGIGMGISGLSAGFTALAGSTAMETIASHILTAAKGAEAASSAAVTATATMLTGGLLVLVAAIAAVAFGIKKYNEHIKKEAEEVTQNYQDRSQEHQTNLTNLKQWKSELATLSKGVDENGLNVSLDASDYQHYLEIVDGIAKINPEIVKGYNAQGHAIIDNNKALEETLALEEKRSKQTIEDYTSDDSLRKLLKARNLEGNRQAGGGSGDKYIETIDFELEPRTDMRHQISQIGSELRRNKDKIDLSSLGIDIDALAAGSEEEFKKVADNIDVFKRIVTDSIHNAGDEWSEASKESIEEAFDSYGDASAELNELTQPIYDALSVKASQTAGFQSMAEDLKAPFQKVLKDLATTGDFSNGKDIGEAAKEAALKFAGYNEIYLEAMQEVEAANKQFALDFNETEYDANTANAIQNLEDLKATLEDTPEGHAISEWIDNEINKINNHLTGGAASVEQAWNTMTDKIAAAESAADDFKKSTEKDFSTAAEGMKEIYDTAMGEDTYHDYGFGDNTFWEAAQKLLGKENIMDVDTDTVRNMMKDVEPFLKEGPEGVQNFANKVAGLSDQLDEAQGGIKGVKMTSDGWFESIDENVNPDVWKELSAALGVSEELLTSMLNKARQFRKISFSDMDSVREAYAADETVIHGTQQTTITTTDESGKEKEITTDKLYITDAELQNQMGSDYYNKEEREKKTEELNAKGIEILPEHLKELDASMMKNELGIQDMTGAIETFGKTGVFDKTEIQDAARTIAEAEAKARGEEFDEKTFNTEFNEEWASYLENMEYPTLEPLQSIESLVSSIASAVTTKQIENGVLANRRSDEINNTINGKEGVDDTLTDFFRQGKDIHGNDLTKYTYEKGLNELEDLRSGTQSYLNSLQEGRKKATGEERARFDQEIQETTQLLGDLDGAIESGKQKWEEFNSQETKDDTSTEEQSNTSPSPYTDEEKDYYSRNSPGEWLKKLFAGVDPSTAYTGDNDYYSAKDGGEKVDHVEITADSIETTNTSSSSSDWTSAKDGGDRPTYTEITGTSKDTSSALADGGAALTEAASSFLTAIQGLTTAGETLNTAGQNLTNAAAVLVTNNPPQGNTKSPSSPPGMPSNVPQPQAQQSSVSGAIVVDNSAALASLDEIKAKAEETKATIDKGATFAVNVEDNGLSDVASKAAKITNAAGNQNINVTATASGNSDEINDLTGAVKKFKELGSGKTIKLKTTLSGASTSSIESQVAAINAFHLKTDHTVTLKTIKKTETVGGDAIGTHNHGYVSAPPSLGSAARGSYGQVGPKGKGGLTLTGELGYEIAWLPDENRSMILGANGPQMVNLPGNAVVWTHEQSKQIMKQKAIPAGSHGNPTKVTSSGGWNWGNTSGGGGGGSNNNYFRDASDGLINQAKKTGDDLSKTAKNTSKAIARVTVWWENAARRAESIQRRMDANQRTYERYLKEMQATLKTTGTIGKGDAFIASNEAYIAQQQLQYKKATAELNQIDSGKWQSGKKKGKSATSKKTKKKKKNQKAYEQGAENIIEVSYEGKNKKGEKTTKTSYRNTAPYIKTITNADGSISYQIDQKKLTQGKTKIKNKSERKAFAEALNKELNDRISKQNAAEDAIVKAKEALDKMGEELYETFHGWEIELTKIWNITQQIEQTQARIARNEAFTDLFGLQIETGLRQLDNNTQELDLALFKDNLTSQNNLLYQREELLKQNKDELNRFLNTSDKKSILQKVNKKLKSGSLNATEAQEYLTYQKHLEDEIKVAETAAKYTKITRLGDGTIKIDFDTNALEQARLDTTMTDDFAKAVQDWVKKAEELSQNVNDTINSLTEDQAKFYNILKDLQKQIADYSVKLVDINEKVERKRIDQLKKLSDSVKKAIDKLLKEVKNKLDERRKQEDNIKTEQDISKKQQRLAALQADTSGGHQVEIAQLQKEIADAQQNYQRSLEDQLIEKLQQQSDIATEQRERQIELQEQLVSSVNNINQVNKWLEHPESFKEEIIQRYLESEDYDNQPIKKQEDLLREADKFYEDILTNQEKQESAIKSINNINATLTQLDKFLRIQNSTLATAKENQLSAKEAATIFNATPSQLNTIGKYTAEDFVAADMTNKLAAAGFSASAAEAAGVKGIRALQGAGYNSQQIRGIYDAKAFYDDKQTYAYAKSAGFSRDELWRAGYTSDILAEDKAKEAAALAEKQRQEAEAQKKKEQQLYNTFVQNFKNLDLGSDALMWTTLPSADKALFQSIIQKHKGEFVKNKKNREARISANGLVYMHDGKGTVYTIDPWSGKISKIKYSQSSYEKKYKNATNVKPVYKAALHQRGVKGYKTGGLANYTGPAWLDGTPSKPELVLNAQDTKNFIALKDVLSKAIGSTGAVENTYGNATYEININVDHLNNDYDVDKVVERVKKKIVQDSSYRNVTQVRKFR